MKHCTKFVWKVWAFVGMICFIVIILWNIVTFTRPQLCYNPNKTTLVFGNSRIQYGFDDSDMPAVWNVGLNADNYNIIYWKLKMLHRYNKQIKNVILEVDQTFLFNYFEGVEYKLHPYYWDVIDFTDWVNLFEKDRVILMYPFDWIKILTPIKSLFSTVSFQDLGVGGYSMLNRDKLKEALMADGDKVNGNYNVNELQLEYLNKIIEYCSQNNICIKFVSMPSYPTKGIIEGHKQANQYIKKHYSDIQYLDYELIELVDSCYGDITHLNHRGAKALIKRIKMDL